MATAEHILQIERGIVVTLEREMHRMIRQKDQERLLETRRNKVEQNYRECEERKVEERTLKAEEAADRLVKSKIRQQQRQEALEEDRQMMAIVHDQHLQRAVEKQEHIVAEREALVNHRRAEGEAKREYLREVKEEYKRVQEAKLNEMMARRQTHEIRQHRKLERVRLDMKDKRMHRESQEQKHAEKREAHRQYQEETKQQAEDTLRLKYEKTARMEEMKAADIRNLELIKQKFENKKQEIADMVVEAERTGNTDKVMEALRELKEEQHEMEQRAKQEWADRSALSRTLSPGRFPAMQGKSASPSSASINLPVSPQYSGFLKRGGVRRPMSAGASGQLSRSPAGGFSPDRTQSCPRRAFASSPLQKDMEPPGTHYNHLMGLFKETLYSTPNCVVRIG